MKRMLCQIVILLLLVIAPVSFSTDKIPNFDKPATQNTQLEESGKTSISVVRRAVRSAKLPSFTYRSQQCYLSAPILSIFDYHSEIPHGRAPPVALTV